MHERHDYQLTKSNLHRKILDRLDPDKLRKTSGESARGEILVVVRDEVNAEVVPLSFAERERLAQEILQDILANPEHGDAAGIAVKKPRSPNLNRGSTAASLDE
jgi:hypothetical protein